MLHIRHILLILGFLLLQSCAGTSHRQRAEQGSVQMFPHPLPEVPSSITEAKEQAQYMLQHYWDKFDFSHKSILQNKDSFEEAFANYFGLLTSLDSKETKEALLYPLNNSLDSVLKEELRLYRKYLYAANSPMINNELYEEVLNWTLGTPRTSALQKEEARLLLRVISKNKVGTIATNFIYETADSTKHHLRNLLSPYSLLVFAKSDCATCKSFVEQIKGNKDLEAELNRLKLQIVLIYIDRTNIEEQLKDLPKSVIAGFDSEGAVLDKQLYDIKATPTFYLLKRGGEVLLKETYPDAVLNYLNELH